MNVRHPAYGAGVVKAIAEHTVEIMFDDGRRTVSPENSAIQPAEPTASVTGLEMPLARLVEQITRSVVEELGLDRPGEEMEELGSRWKEGTLVLKPADESLQSKDVPLETFFHKIVMMRNQLRVLEQKINSHDKFSEAEKVELQQYITRCYGSMTTFNVLFRDKEDQF